MTPTPPRRGRLTTAGLALLTATLVPGLAQLPALAAPTAPAAPGDRPQLGTSLLDPAVGLPDTDERGSVTPAAAQRTALRALGAVDARFNQFGTPSSILPADGSLGSATASDPVAAARAWLQRHAAAFGLTAADMTRLELVNAQVLAGSEARAVLFRQDFGGLTPALAGMVTVGVANGQIAYASSSLARDPQAPPAATMGPAAAFAAAARSLGRGTDADDIDVLPAGTRPGWTVLDVPGFAEDQQVRLRALALADGAVRPVFETNVVETSGGSASAYTLMVDAVDGRILHRHNQAESSNDAFPFTGSVTATECGVRHPFELTDDRTRRIDAVATLAVPSNDVVVKLFGPGGELLASGDLGTSPEAASYAGGALPAGTYTMQVCPFASPTAPFLPPGDYAATVTTSDVGAPSGGAATNPRWRYFTANPTLDFGPGTPANSVIGCWLPGPGCTTPSGELRNPAAFGPWDTTASGVPTFTTLGNNASTREAWLSPLTPGGAAQAPVSPTREYTTAFTDTWNNSRCDPTTLTPGGNDILASVANLFVAHNRMHDYSYYLGFTEANYNLQLENAGRGGVPGDPEVGNAQAGAISGGSPSYLGRDNANQITLQDGTPGVTNQYLFQPIAGAFYAPCTDGGLDMGIVGHEYTHAISNRMVAGPDEGLTSEQGGAMGESWGDLVAGEYMFSHGYANGGNPWAVGVYATGNKDVAIRDYAINRNPLNYSDYGFDSTGNEVHADGEIWNGTQWSVRQALVNRYDARFPYRDRALQLRCAQASGVDSPQRAALCPGNRRWVQLMFDSFLLQQGATSMLDARDAMIAAARMRFPGSGGDVKAMWDAFASRGMGRGASTPDADSGETRPSFVSPTARNGTLRFDAPGGGRVYVGQYEARVTPVADTDPATAMSSKEVFTPGRYDLLYVSPSSGFSRFSVTVRPGESRTVRVPAPRNLAARAAGASVIAESAGSRNAGALIDGTEATNWGGVSEENVDTSRPFVAVDLAGGVRTVRRVQVSAMLRPSDADPDEIPLPALAADPDAGSRFTALRRFALEACVSACSTPTATWRRFYTSPADAFPAVQPRPVAPDLTLRGFDVPDTRAAAVRLVTLENQCTGFAGYAGEQDADPLNDTDCATASDRGTIVHAAELQVY